MKAPQICKSRPSQKWNWISRLNKVACPNASNATRLLKRYHVLFKKVLSTIFAILGLQAPLLAAEQPPVFSLHLIRAPASLSPFDQRNSSAGYLLSQIYAPLLKLKDGQLEPYLGRCKLNHKKVLCHLRESAKWNDGSDLLAKHYVTSFQEFTNPKRLRQSALLENLKSVRALNDRTLELELKEVDPHFLLSLANPLLTPLKSTQPISIAEAEKLPSAGPYQIQSWDQKLIRLRPNPHWPHASRLPAVEFLFIKEDSVALGLYEKNKLSYLRRLPTFYFEKMKDRKDLYKISQFRFDYLGFSQKLRSYPELRKALGESLDYEELQRLYHAWPRPGCPGFPESLLLQKSCWSFQGRTKFNLSALNLPFTLNFHISKQGGDDHKRTAEWLQAQWRKHLDLRVSIQQMDDKILFAKLKSDPPAIFRKGINPDRPTCYDALKVFHSQSAENYLKLQNPEFDRLIEELKFASQAKATAKFCSEAIALLVNGYHIIPLGPIYFAVLAKPQWQGWSLNELNQLNLSELRYVP